MSSRTLENMSGENVDKTDIFSFKGLSSSKSPVQKIEKAGQQTITCWECSQGN